MMPAAPRRLLMPAVPPLTPNPEPPAMSLPKTLLAAALGLGLGFLPLASTPPTTTAAQSQKMLCAANEQLIFGGVTTGGKMVCLCGSPNLTAQRGYLQYRFGRPGRIELEYPAERAGSQQRFYYAHYTRFQREWASVRFRNQEYNYRLFYSFDGETGRPTTEYGLNVYLGEGDKGTNFTLRRNTVVGRLQALEDILPCDREDPTNDCP